MRALLCTVTAALLAVSHPARCQSVTNRRIVEASVDSLMRAYATAFQARDGNRVAAFYAPGNETAGWVDGHFLSHEPYVAALRGFLKSVHDVTVRYDTIQAHAITNDVGAVWTTLAETWTDSAGTIRSMRVRASWVAKRTPHGWKLVYFDGRHAAPDSISQPR